MEGDCGDDKDLCNQNYQDGLEVYDKWLKDQENAGTDDDTDLMETLIFYVAIPVAAVLLIILVIFAIKTKCFKKPCCERKKVPKAPE